MLPKNTRFEVNLTGSIDENRNRVKRQLVYQIRVMSIESAIEQIIREGMARGDFDNLKGKGKPLNLDDYFNTPEDVRMGFSVLKSNDFVPEEVERLKDIAEIREKLLTVPEGEEKHALEKKLRDKTLELSLILERNKRKK